MLLNRYKNLSESRIIKGATAFFYSKWYYFAVALVMACSNLFALEFVAFYLFMLAVIFTTLFCKDTFPLMPLAFCAPMLFSAKNNPAKYAGETIFSKPANMAQFIAICAVIAVCLIARLVYDLVKTRRQKTAPKLTWGFVALGASYILGGLFSPYYTFKTAVFGLLEIVALSGLYFFFYYTVDWSDKKADEISYMITAVGIGIFAQVVGMYLQPHVLDAIKAGKFYRGLLVTGWGIYNNVGYVMGICIPAPFYLAATKKKGHWYGILGCVFMVGTLLTQSRGSILFALFAFAASAILTLVYARGKQRLKNGLVFAGIAVVALGGVFIFKDRVEALFRSMLDRGFDDSSRFDIYKSGLDQFLEYPVLGQGFYQCTAFRYGNLPKDSFFPSRYHNTVIQLIACCGAVGLLAYLFHIFQTLVIFFKKPYIHRMFLGVMIAFLTLASMLDCHFFNFGPGLHYGIILIFAEMVTDGALRSDESSLKVE